MTSPKHLRRPGLKVVQKARAPIDGYVLRGGDPAPRAFVPQHPEEAQGVLEARKPRAALAVE